MEEIYHNHRSSTVLTLDIGDQCSKQSLNLFQCLCTYFDDDDSDSLGFSEHLHAFLGVEVHVLCQINQCEASFKNTLYHNALMRTGLPLA